MVNNTWEKGTSSKVHPGIESRSEVSSIKNKKDEPYGFKYTYNRKVNYPVKKPMSSGGVIIVTSLISFLVLLWTVAAIISGYHSWTEFPANPLWLKLIRTNLANRLELHLFYSDKENERELTLVGSGKWKDISKDEL